MTDKLQLSGKRFGRLLVLKEHGKDKNGKIRWECVCDCGKYTYPIGSNLISGKTLSCGCIKDEKTSIRMTRHGMSKTKIYIKWQNMKKKMFKQKR